MSVYIVCGWDEPGAPDRGFGAAKAGMFLAHFDPDENDGFGCARWTAHQHEAKVFPDLLAAFAEWKRESTVRPLRDDGKPNRPLSAYTVTFTKEEDFI